MVWSIYPHESSFVETTQVSLAGIPALKFRPKGAEGLLPTVIMYHGWHSSKEFKRFEAMTIAAQGYQVFVPDALHHGDRDPIDYDAPGVIDQMLWPIILQSLNESDALLSAIQDGHDADPKRIAVMGSSMGAITAGGIFAKHCQLKCLVGFMGTFAWEEAARTGVLPKAASQEAQILASDPLRNAENLANRPILMCNGKADTSIPFESQSFFYEQLKPFYEQCPEKLQLIGWDDLPHTVSMSMYQQAVMWFKTYLE